VKNEARKTGDRFVFGKNKPMRKYLGVVIISFLACSMAHAQDIQFSVSADKTVATLGEQIMVTAQVVSTKKLASITAPQIPKSEDFDVVGTNQNQSSSTSIQVINGKMTQTVTMTYLFYFSLVPKKQGSLTFPALRFTADGAEYASNPFVINVGKEPPQAATEVKASLILNKRSLYIGEQAILTVQVAQKAGTQVQLTQQGLAELYDKVEKAFGKDFAVARLFSQLPTKGGQQALGGENYFVVKVQYAVFPLNSGEIRVSPVPFQYVAVKRVQGRRGGGSFFDEFFNDNFFGGGVEQIAKSVLSNQLDVRVTPLPAPPAGFSGAVGSFKLTASIDPHEVPSGEAATLTCSITGTTRPGSVGDIAIGQLPDCAIFAPEKNIRVDTTETGIVTHKTWKYLVIPKQEGTLGVPPVAWSYFDPSAKAYKTIKTDSLKVTVTKGKEAPGGQSRYLTQEEIRQVGQDIRFIKTGMKIRRQSWQQYKNPLFLLLYLLPFCIALFSLLYKIQSKRYEKDATLALRQKAYRSALKKIAGLQKQAGRMSIDVFLSKITECLEGYISQKFGFSASGKVLSEVRQQLCLQGAPDRLTDDIVAYLERMDTFRFGGAALDASLKASLLETIKGFVRDLDKVRKEKPA
jgi:hypothetical protein